MSYAVITIPALGPVTKISQPKAPDLDQLQALVGGYIERVPYFRKLSHESILYTHGQAWADEDDMQRAASNIAYAFDEHRRFMTDWLDQFRQALEQPHNAKTTGD